MEGKNREDSEDKAGQESDEYIFCLVSQWFQWHKCVSFDRSLVIFVIVPKCLMIDLATVMGYIVSSPNSYVEMLTLGTSECNCIWREGFYRGNKG